MANVSDDLVETIRDALRSDYSYSDGWVNAREEDVAQTVADSLAPVEDEVLAIGEWRTNAQVIEAAAKLGYLPSPVIDLTYGAAGGFWKKHHPDTLITNDLYHDAMRHDDFRQTPWGDQTFNTVVFDPPYKLAGLRTNGEDTLRGAPDMDGRYGTAGDYVPAASVAELIADGVREACRISRNFVLVKCMDQVSSGRVHWQTDDVTAVAKECGFYKKDLLLLKGMRAQPPNGKQVHARRNYSSLIVLARSK